MQRRQAKNFFSILFLSIYRALVHEKDQHLLYGMIKTSEVEDLHKGRIFITQASQKIYSRGDWQDSANILPKS